MTAAAPRDQGGGWQRLHPSTPFVRSWAAVLVGLGIVTQGILPGLGQPAPGNGLALPLQLLGILVLAVLSLVSNVVSWWTTTYRVADGAVQQRSGLVSRTSRQAPLDRIQAVDLVQPVVGRIFGLAELRIEVAGGDGSLVRLAYLPQSAAESLRERILADAPGAVVAARAAVRPGVDAPPGPPSAAAAPAGDAAIAPGGAAPAPPAETPVLAVPAPRLIASLLLSSVGTAVVVAVVAVVLVATRAGVAALAGIFPLVFGLGGYVFSSFARSFDFRLAVAGDGVRIRAGLTETRASFIPPGRVQAVRLEQPLLWRTRDWWNVTVNVAGYGAGEADARQRTVMLPVGTRLDALWVLRLVLPDAGLDDPLPVLRQAMSGSGSGHGFTVSPRRAAWLAPLSYRRNGFVATRTAVLVRSGALRRRLVVVPHLRTQSLALRQGPVQRLLGLADVGLHSTPGPVDPQVTHLDQVAASRLVDAQAGRAGRARAVEAATALPAAAVAAGPAADGTPQT